MLLVFGCIGTDFCKKIRVLQHFSKSTRWSSWNFEIWQYFANFATFAKMLLNFHENCWFFKPIFCENFEIAAVQKYANLVELEKCCQTHIFLQNFVLMQPRTSPPKIWKNLPILLTLTPSSIATPAQLPPAIGSAAWDPVRSLRLRGFAGSFSCVLLGVARECFQKSSYVILQSQQINISFRFQDFFEKLISYI